MKDIQIIVVPAITSVKTSREGRGEVCVIFQFSFEHEDFEILARFKHDAEYID